LLLRTKIQVRFAIGKEKHSKPSTTTLTVIEIAQIFPLLSSNTITTTKYIIGFKKDFTYTTTHHDDCKKNRLK